MGMRWVQFCAVPLSHALAFPAACLPSLSLLCILYAYHLLRFYVPSQVGVILLLISLATVELTVWRSALQEPALSCTFCHRYFSLFYSACLPSPSFSRHLLPLLYPPLLAFTTCLSSPPPSVSLIGWGPSLLLSPTSLPFLSHHHAASHLTLLVWKENFTQEVGTLGMRHFVHAFETPCPMPGDMLGGEQVAWLSPLPVPKPPCTRPLLSLSPALPASRQSLSLTSSLHACILRLGRALSMAYLPSFPHALCLSLLLFCLLSFSVPFSSLISLRWTEHSLHWA